MNPYFWKNLLTYIQEQRVVPIIGPELLVIRDGGEEKTFLRYVAERLAAEVGVSAENLSNDSPLNDVVCQLVQQRKGAREDVYPIIKEIATDTKLSVPEPLRKLARIYHFKLFVTTTFDMLLERALNDERPQTPARSLTYAPKEWEDLPTNLKGLSSPVVFHLMGRAAAYPDSYVVTEEDALEFLHGLQEKEKRPTYLFDELKKNNLLIIGSNFPDWLARFFIRVVKGQRLSTHNEQLVLADRKAGADNSLVVFLEHFTNRTTIFEPGGASEFVDELYDRYAKGNLGATQVSVAGATQSSNESSAPLIFLSYAREDSATVKIISATLIELGWRVWFDENELAIGDQWDPKIEDSINDCLLFLPVVSANTEQRLEAYFRKEWNRAAERSQRFDKSTKFLLPVALDEKIEKEHAHVPKEFKGSQWHTLRGGVVNEDFKTAMRDLLRDYRLKEQHR